MASNACRLENCDVGDDDDGDAAGDAAGAWDGDGAGEVAPVASVPVT